MRDNRLSNSQKIVELELQLHPFVKQGFMNFYPFKWREVRISQIRVSLQRECVDFIFEDRYKQELPFNLPIKDCITYLKENFYTIKPQLLVEKEVDFSKQYSGIEIIRTKNYRLFQYKESCLSELVKGSIESIGNIMPITVCKVNEMYVVIDGNKRISYLIKEGKEIFCIDVTSLLSFSQLTETFKLTSSNQLSSTNLQTLWANKCLRLNKYREIERFFTEERVENYVNKYRLLLLSTSLSLQRVYSNQLELQDCIDMFQRVVDWYSTRNYRKITKEIKDSCYKDILYEVKKERESVIYSIRAAAVKFEKGILTYTKGIYSIEIRYGRSNFVLEEIKEGGMVERVNVFIHTKDIYTFVNRNRHILETVLSCETTVDNFQEHLQID